MLQCKISSNRENSFTVFLSSPLQEIEQEYIVESGNDRFMLCCVDHRARCLTSLPEYSVSWLPAN